MALVRSLYTKLPLELRNRIRPLKHARIVFDAPSGPSPRESLWRTEPVSRLYGSERGTPIDRYYIEQFLGKHATDIRGRVLEIQDNGYTTRFGGDQVAQSDVLHIDPGHPGVTIVADLCDAPEIASDSFDCIILTQTLLVIPDLPAVAETLARILKPDGILLVTTGGISRICHHEDEMWGHYWNLTRRSVELVFAGPFAEGTLEIESYGNVLSAICSLQGFSAEELDATELDLRDEFYPVILGLRVAKLRV